MFFLLTKFCSYLPPFQLRLFLIMIILSWFKWCPSSCIIIFLLLPFLFNFSLLFID